jgi:hypothetical protein
MTSGMTRLKMSVKISLKRLLIVFSRVQDAHNFSPVTPLLAMRHPMKILRALLFLLLLAGCSDDIEKIKLTKEERERILPLQNPFGSNLIRLNPVGEAGPVLIGREGCRVYRAETEQGVVTEWVRVPELRGQEFLSGGSGCERERMDYDGKYLTVEFCRMLIGAGGGCGGGISPHRSRNGKDWEVQVGKDKWKPVSRVSVSQ